MKDNRLGGIALIIGAVSGMITMSLHPVAGAGVQRRADLLPEKILKISVTQVVNAVSFKK